MTKLNLLKLIETKVVDPAELMIKDNIIQLKEVNTMQKDNLAIINTDTGEIVKELKEGDSLRTKKQMASDRIRMSKIEIKSLEQLLLEFDEDKDLDKLKNEIYSTMKLIKEIDSYGKHRTYGIQKDNDLFKKSLEFGTLAIKFIDLMDRVNSRNFINADITNRNISTWKQLLDELEIKKPANRTKFKRLLSKLDMIRQYNRNGDKLLVFNPMIYRKWSHASAVSLACFKDVSLKKIHTSNAMLLFMDGLIDRDDVEKIK